MTIPTHPPRWIMLLEHPRLQRPKSFGNNRPIGQTGEPDYQTTIPLWIKGSSVLGVRDHWNPLQNETGACVILESGVVIFTAPPLNAGKIMQLVDGTEG